MQDANAVLFVVGLALGGTAFVALVFGIRTLLAPHKPTPEKLEPFECGMPPAGEAHPRVRLRFALIALFFVLFDAESVLLFAVVGQARGSVIGLAEVTAFTLMLAAGLVYAWRKGALEWPS